VTKTDHLERVEQRQEAMIASLNRLVSGMGIQQAMLEEIMAWLKKPPSSELPDLLRQLIDAVLALQARIEARE